MSVRIDERATSWQHRSCCNFHNRLLWKLYGNDGVYRAHTYTRIGSLSNAPNGKKNRENGNVHIDIRKVKSEFFFSLCIGKFFLRQKLSNKLFFFSLENEEERIVFVKETLQVLKSTQREALK